ncbi:MAG: hypothetical protein HWQ41_18270 [Nostoc sp. NOS(2021)]|uniref:hypothetical protein n=1 Tax=Nostoc sp. NOS(2021) TaxID=2815407 RepID=UPI0025CC074E|nr:hypothetical protein [Nostoc sp. NOS(2021)]MBN3897146.1 hypothetical protein [Nostoc sp. NOS(2021)]
MIPLRKFSIFLAAPRCANGIFEKPTPYLYSGWCRRCHNPQELPESAKFQYLTLLNGITYETHWLAWCDQVIQTIEKL